MATEPLNPRLKPFYDKTEPNIGITFVIWMLSVLEAVLEAASQKTNAVP